MSASWIRCRRISTAVEVPAFIPVVDLNDIALGEIFRAVPKRGKRNRVTNEVYG